MRERLLPHLHQRQRGLFQRQRQVAAREAAAGQQASNVIGGSGENALTTGVRGATIAGGQGTGTIVNDDVAPTLTLVKLVAAAVSPAKTVFSSPKPVYTTLHLGGNHSFFPSMPRYIGESNLSGISGKLAA